MSDAPRPQGVRIVRADGHVIACELAYVGLETDDEGVTVDMWEVITPVNQGDQVHADVLPARTGIRFPMDGDDRNLTMRRPG